MTEMCSTRWISFKSSDYDRQLMISFWRQKNQQRLKGWTWWQVKHGYNGNFDQRFICGCKHYLIIVGVISFEVYKKKKVNMKSVVSSVNGISRPQIWTTIFQLNQIITLINAVPSYVRYVIKSQRRIFTQMKKKLRIIEAFI